MAGGDGDWGEVGLAAFPESEALPVEAGRRGGGGGKPVEHHIVEELVGGEDRRRVAGAGRSVGYFEGLATCPTFTQRRSPPTSWPTPDGPQSCLVFSMG